MINMEIDNKKKIIVAIILIIAVLIIFAVYLLSNQESFEDFTLNEIVLEENNQTNENITTNTENIVSEENTNENKIETEIKEIVVHITGAVKKEGIVYLKEGDRIIDAIEKAGGETKNADLSQVNLAYVLSDGQKIYIPNKNEKIDDFIIVAGTGITTNTSQASTGTSRNAENNTGTSKVNINTANEVELDSLPGIGPSIAKKIVTYRNENGKFNNIEDIKNVSGIGDAKYEELKNYITV